jgi:signal transduction histidine kinase
MARVRGVQKVAPKTFQSRLTIGFVSVVALTLIVVTALVLNRLDDYFTKQQDADLQARANNVANYVASVAVSDTNGERPVVNSDGIVDDVVVHDITSDRQQKALANVLGQADVTIRIGAVTAAGFVPAQDGVFTAALTAQPAKGQTREPTASESTRVRVNGIFPFWVEVTLSNPYTFRATAVANVVGLLAVTGLLAMLLAMVVTVFLARRFTTPLRRLTEAARELAEGNLTSRVPVDNVQAGSAELTELAVQFNTMADRLEQSVAIIRGDRDRSRDFLADVSHELRTPIAALRTFNELVKEQAANDPEARAEFLESSGQQIDRLDWLAQNLLELSKLDSGLVLLDLRPDDLRAAAESAVEQARPAARRRGISLELSLPDRPLRIHHDPQRIGQVVSNLVGNAIKFTPRGGSVSVRVQPHVDGGQLEVTDTGIGIDASELPRIFDRFYRGSRANEARGSGSGLGLAIVRSIVDMHRGGVVVESRVGGGSRFVVTLPRDPRTVDAPPDGLAPRSDAMPDEASVDPTLSTPAAAALGLKVVDSSPQEGSRLNPGTSP